MRVKFSGIIRIDLTKAGEQVYSVTAADRLWLSKVVSIAGAVQLNPHGDAAHTPILGIRIQERSNDQLPWAIFDGYMNSFSGQFDTLYITVLSNPAGDAAMFLNTGSGVAAGYCDPDGLSPVVGQGAVSPVGSGGSSTVYI